MIGQTTEFFTSDEYKPVQITAEYSGSGAAITIISGMSYGLISIVPSIVGIAVAAVTGFAALRFMLKMISRVPLSWFALYVALLGIAWLLLQLGGSPLVPAFALPAAAQEEEAAVGFLRVLLA